MASTSTNPHGRHRHETFKMRILLHGGYKCAFLLYITQTCGPYHHRSEVWAFFNLIETSMIADVARR